jgi:1-deoxy-D-xylulose-5-phosphate synthase
MRFVKPLDEQLLHGIFKAFKTIITVEDAAIQGGFGSAIAEFMVDHQYQAKIIRLGIADLIVEHGEQKELYEFCGIDSASILAKILQEYPIKTKVINTHKSID